MAAWKWVASSLKARRSDLVAGFALAVLLFCLVAGYQLGVAAKELDDLRAEPTELLGEPEWPKWIWPPLAAIGALFAFVVHLFLRRRLKARGASRGTVKAFAILTALAVALWLGWQAAGYAVFLDADRPGWTDVVLYGALGVGVLALALAAETVGNPAEGWRAASVVRVQLIVLAALVLGVFLVPLTAAQVNDVLRAWGDGPLSRVATGVAAALLMGAVLRTSASRLLAPHPRKGRWPESNRSALAGMAAAGLVFLALQAWIGLALLGLIAAVAWATRWSDPRQPDAAARYRLLRLAGGLGVVPLAVVYAGLVAALIDTLLLPSGRTTTDTWLLAATVAVGLIFGLFAAFAHPLEDRAAQPVESGRSYAPLVGAAAFLLAAFSFLDVVSVLFVLGAGFVASWVLPERGGSQFWAAGGAALGMAAAVYVDPVAVPRELGALGIILIAAAGLLAALHLAATLGSHRAVRWYFPLLPKQVSVVTLLALWVAAAFWWQSLSDAMHQVRTEEQGRPPGSLSAAARAWLERETAGTDKRVPMVVVAASGGGAKAAYWTGLVVDCLFGAGPPTDAAKECPPAERDLFGRLFLTSSVSGGSIGVYHLLRDRQQFGDWVDTSNGREVLSPVLAWGVFHDLPALMLGMLTDPRRCEGAWSCRRGADRALVQEAAIAGRERIDPPGSEPMLVPAAPRLPVTVFNAALDGAERRVLLSPVLLDTRRRRDKDCLEEGPPQLGPEALDAHDLLAGSPIPAPAPDVPLVTAAHMSARFPVVEPAARLGENGSPGEDDACSVGSRSVLLRDGGYVENAGVLTVDDLLPELRRAIESEKKKLQKPEVDIPIVVVSIDDDPVTEDENPRLDLVPSALGIAKRAGSALLTEGARRRMRRCVYDNVYYRRISPSPHAGAEAATGWELSETARTKDLIESLRPGRTAWERVKELKLIIAGEPDLHCSP